MTSFHSHPEASRELEEASDWYEAQRNGFGLRFTERFVEVVELLREYPTAGTPLGRGRRGTEVRAMLLKDFPARIVYAIVPAGIFVISVAHTSRRVGYWRRRLKDLRS